MDVTVIIAIAIGVAVILLAYFSGIEVAFTSANRLNIELKKQQGASSGILLSNLFDNPSRFIGVNIVGFTFFLVITILLGTALLNEISKKLEIPGDVLPYLASLRLLLEFIWWGIIVVLTRFIPRAIFKTKSDSLLSFSARTGLLGFFDGMFHWFATIFVNLSVFILNVIFDMRIDRRKDAFSRADADFFFQQSKEYSEDGHNLNTELFENALSLAKVKVRECLVPRKEIEAGDMSMTIEELRLKFVETKLSKLVIYDGNIDNIKGYVHQLDLFKHPSSINEILHPIPAIPESMGATDLISKFSKERKSIAWVVDEFDVEEFEEKKVSEEEFIFSGRLELDYLNEKYGLEFPENDSETLSGFIIQRHEAIPRLKERIIIDHYEFEVLNVSDTRIEMVRMKILS